MDVILKSKFWNDKIVYEKKNTAQSYLGNIHKEIANYATECGGDGSCSASSCSISSCSSCAVAE